MTRTTAKTRWSTPRRDQVGYPETLTDDAETKISTQEAHVATARVLVTILTGSREKIETWVWVGSKKSRESREGD